MVQLLSTNVRSLVRGSKREELTILANEHNIDIIAITETWGRSDILDSEFDIPGFRLYRKDRSEVNDKKGGGVALYVANNLRSSAWDELNEKKCESLWCKVYTNDKDYVIVGVCYRSQEADMNEIGQLFECIKTATELNKPVIILGDFNYPGIEWSSLKADDNGQKFLKLVLDCFLEQHVQEPTRLNNILDLVLTSDIKINGEVQILAPVDNADHNVLMCGFQCSADSVNCNREKLCYNQADYDGMRNFVRQKLCEIESTTMSVATLWQHYNGVMQEAIKQFVPISGKVSRKKKPLWMTGRVLRTVKRKHMLWKKWKYSNSDDRYSEYKRQCNMASKSVRLAKRNFEKSIASNIKKDAKSFYAYVKSKSHVKESVGPLKDDTGSLVCTERDMGNLLNTFFASVFTNETMDSLPSVKQTFHGTDNERLCSFSITSEMVANKLAGLKMNKAPGVDRVSTNMLMELSPVITDVVTELFNKLLASADVPPEWKLANVTPIFKKGNKSSPSNYRPVSLTVILCKIFESLLRDKIVEHLEKHELIRESQHGFVKKKSCLSNLLVFMEEVTNYLDSGYPVDVIYLDFQKAFDKVPHQRLLIKLQAHGIGGNVLQWISNWLSGRKQRVILGGQVSDWCNILSGVPQGSVLGPLLFVIYINDIDEVINSKLLKFADDTKIFNKVNSVDEVENLRSDLRSLVSWSKEWQMLFNLEKCKVMHIGFNNPRVDYFMDATRIQEVHEEKDLGVIVSDDLKWDKQCVAAVKKANSLLGMIKRNFIDRSKATVLALYKSLIRPHLEYCIQVWNPHLAKDIKLIEGVQRRATKLVHGIENCKYDDRLKILGLTRLDKRRIRSDLVETFKIMNGFYNINRDLFFELDEGGRRGHEKKLFKKRFRLDSKKFAFSNRVVDSWNSLSVQCVNSGTINTFKKHFSVHLQPETIHH